MDIKKELILCSASPIPFQSFLDRIAVSTNKPCSSIHEFKRRSTKAKGDIFEKFCVLYLEATGYKAWLIKDTPDYVLQILKLKPFDVGIDIVALKDNKYYAVQAKYRQANNKKFNVLGWKELSTFYAMCARSGPWEKHLVMTSCDYIRRLNKDPKDMIINKKVFMKASKDVWKRMAGQEDIAVKRVINKAENSDKDDIRKRRADYFEKLLYGSN